MLNKILLITLLIVVSIQLRADTIEINPDHPDRYVVEKGDTLWDIAGRFLQEPWRWPEVWKTNPQIVDPHLIYPGDVISFSYDGETPVLTVERGSESGQPRRRKRVVTDRNIKLSPAIRKYQRDAAIPSIPIEAIRHFLSRPLVVNEDDMNNWPYVVSSFEQHLVAGPGTRVYIRGIPAGSNVQKYSVYRKGPAYRSQSRYGSDILGYEAIYVAEAVVIKHGDPATVIITQSSREVLIGDRLLPQSEQEVSSDFIPHSPANRVNGSIISVVDGVFEIGQYQIVVLDVGVADGLEQGNILGIFQSGDIINDKIGIEQKSGLNNSALVEYLGKLKAVGEEVHLPDEYTGVLMIFRAFNKISYAIIMEAHGAVHLHDKVRNI